MSFSATKEGQFYFHLLKEFGLTLLNGGDLTRVIQHS